MKNLIEGGRERGEGGREGGREGCTYMSLSIPRGPKVDRTVSATACVCVCVVEQEGMCVST